ncbi:MAG: TIR domain-containing protein [Lachnospiraceae bacterium]|nr:TIR domain-containing protein [Lachnospiraceae bacterium]
MARIIGTIPDKMSLPMGIMYDFITKELPDYIGASLAPEITSESGEKYGFDMLLFIPHMGVFILDIKSINGFGRENGQWTYRYADGKKSFVDPEKREKRKAELREYLKMMFNLSPLIYEFECLPCFDIHADMLPPDFDPSLLVVSDDIMDSSRFLHKVLGISIRLKRGDREGLYDDLTDKDSHDLFYFWETGLYGAPRPERPPFVFLSYNQNNSELSKEVQTALEDRGVYVWRAPKDVPMGQFYLNEEMQAIEECDAFVILLSIPAQRSEEVKKEFVKALEINKPILPLWVENLPDSEISDYFKSNLTEYQYRIMPKINEEIIDELVETVKKIKRESR